MLVLLSLTGNIELPHTLDLFTIGRPYAALNHTVAFLISLVLFILFAIWIIPKIWHGTKQVYGFIKRLFISETDPAEKSIE